MRSAANDLRPGADVMSRNVVTASPGATIQRVANLFDCDQRVEGEADSGREPVVRPLRS